MTTTTDTRTAIDIRELDLQHFSPEEMDFDSDWYYSSQCHAGGKPDGFWVSVENLEGWTQFVSKAGLVDYIPDLAYSLDVTICEPDEVLIIDSHEALLKLTNEFGERDLEDGKMRMSPFSWELFREYYAGVLFIGEGWYSSLRSKDTEWSHGLDCDSGVIWDLSVISVSESRPTGIKVELCSCGSGEHVNRCYGCKECEECGATYRDGCNDDCKYSY